MKLLISPKDKEEAIEAIRGGADIIDVKNPDEGSLGANFPWVIKEIRKLVPENIEVSATIGDFPNLPGTASLAALGVASIGVDYVKVGLYGINKLEDAIKLSSSVVRAVKDFNKKTRVVISGYADFHRIDSINYSLIPEITRRTNADFAMLDTAIKDGRNIFNFLTLEELRKFVVHSHKNGISVAFGGSLRKEHIETLCDMEVDVIGIRGAVCERNDRRGRISFEKVQYLRNIIDNYRK
ncbi:MAG TPA: (5-formylfuran-3-yl)methyl phosphate synthase [Candidatus Altiarchaeales archaeon]|nr:(5-formylfuran-3-yl)methyl phosphate synthase [Candidatus Altiarchaeales archaeon]